MLNATFLVIFKHCAIVKKCYELKKNSRQILSLKSKQKQKLERWLVSLKFARKNNQKVEFYLLLKDRMPIAKISTFCTLVALLFSPSMSDLGSANLPFILKTRERGGFCSSIRSKDESWNINIKRNLWWRRKLYTYQLPQKKPMVTVFENHRKSRIQHCERSELRLHFEWTKIN